MKLFAVALAALVPCLASGAGEIKGKSFGNPAAPLRVDVYSDFQCPGCKTFHEQELPQLIRDYVYSGKMFLTYRYFPLDGHPYGRMTAEFVCAASRVGKYEQVVDALFASQQAWSMSGKVEQTVDSVLTPAEARKVRTLLKDPGVQGEIQRDLAAGRAVPVLGTPALVVTYKQRRYPISGLNNYSLLKSFLDGLLKN